jgi:Putative DNA-binding domain
MSLLALQRDFRAWLIIGESCEAAKFGAAARAGLGVYQNNYRAQLVACLEDAYARVKAWLGDEPFLAATIAHIEQTHPRDWSLDRYGHDFAETLRTRYPQDPEVAELAWLDRTLADVLVAPDANPLEPDQLAIVDWEHAVLRLTPSLRLGRLTTNSAAIWSALSAGTVPPSVEQLPTPATLLVWRQGFTSCFRTLDGRETQAIEHVRAGRTFGALCANLVGSEGEEAGVRIAGTWLAQWLREGLLVGVEAHRAAE